MKEIFLCPSPREKYKDTFFRNKSVGYQGETNIFSLSSPQKFFQCLKSWINKRQRGLRKFFLFSPQKSHHFFKCQETEGLQRRYFLSLKNKNVGM